jgi:hypothetical protein
MTPASVGGPPRTIEPKENTENREKTKKQKPLGQSPYHHHQKLGKK